jgi:hypothetical protein
LILTPLSNQFANRLAQGVQAAQANAARAIKDGTLTSADTVRFYKSTYTKIAVGPMIIVFLDR